MLATIPNHAALVLVLFVVLLGAGASTQFVLFGETTGHSETSIEASMQFPSEKFTSSEISASNAITHTSSGKDHVRFGFEASENETVDVLLPIENVANRGLIGSLELTQTEGPSMAEVSGMKTEETFDGNCEFDDVLGMEPLRWEVTMEPACADYLKLQVEIPANATGGYTFEAELSVVGTHVTEHDPSPTSPSGSLTFEDQSVSEETVEVSGVTFAATADETATASIETTDGDEIGSTTISSPGDHEIEIDINSFDSGETLTAVLYETADRDVILDTDTATISYDTNEDLEGGGSGGFSSSEDG